jgi:hypothetical protein
VANRSTGWSWTPLRGAPAPLARSKAAAPVIAARPSSVTAVPGAGAGPQDAIKAARAFRVAASSLAVRLDFRHESPGKVAINSCPGLPGCSRVTSIAFPAARMPAMKASTS